MEEQFFSFLCHIGLNCKNIDQERLQLAATAFLARLSLELTNSPIQGAFYSHYELHALNLKMIYKVK